MEIRVTPIHTFKLDQSLNSQERIDFINNILQQEIELDDLRTTVEEYFRETWKKQNTKVCLDIIGYYLSKSVESRNKHDKEVMSWFKEQQMRNGNKNYTPYSSLSKKEKILLGLLDIDDK